MPLVLRATTLVLLLFRIWKRLPARQRRQVLWAAGRHAPRIGLSVWRARSRARS
jgi:hypothetical protein